MDNYKLVHVIVEGSKAVKIMSTHDVICYGHLFNYKSDNDKKDDWRFHASNDVSLGEGELSFISQSIKLLNKYNYR